MKFRRARSSTSDLPDLRPTVRSSAGGDVAVLGAGIAGLAAALAFARSGRAVILVERDQDAPPADPDDSFLDWNRPGVPQRRLLHGLVPLGRLALRAHLSDVVEKLDRIGAHDVDMLDPMLDRSRVDGDEDLVIMRCRRTVFEWILRKTVREDSRVSLLAGEVAVGLEAQPPVAGGLPRVTGVRMRSGRVVRTRLVVDATGRSSPAIEWLAAVGVTGAREFRQPCGVIYYTRFYERSEPGFPIGFRAQLGYGLVSASAADGRCFDITFFVRAEEPGLRRLRNAEAFERAVGSIPGLDSWREGARPIGPVAVMGALENRLRSFLFGGRPVVAGWIPVGDSLSLTNPTLGRGMSLAIDQAFKAARINWEGRALELSAGAYHAEVDSLAQASYADAAAADRIATQAYAGDPAAARNGRTIIGRAIPLAAAADPDLFRAIVRHAGLIDPPGSLYAEPWLGRARTLLKISPAPSPGPDLDRMLNLLQG